MKNITHSSYYRLGMLACGDQILSVNDRCTTHMEPYEFDNLVRGEAVPIQLTFRKDEEILGVCFILLFPPLSIFSVYLGINSRRYLWTKIHKQCKS